MNRMSIFCMLMLNASCLHTMSDRPLRGLDLARFQAATRNSEGKRIAAELRQAELRLEVGSGGSLKRSGSLGGRPFATSQTEEDYDKEVTSGGSWYSGFEEESGRGSMFLRPRDPGSNASPDDDELLSPEECARIAAALRTSVPEENKEG